MRRSFRILLHAATALSLLLCLATLALWRRSYATTDQLYLKAFVDDRLADPPYRELTWLRQDLLQSAGGRIHLARFLVAHDRRPPEAGGKTYQQFVEPEMRDSPFHVATPATQPLRRYMRLTTPPPPAHGWWPFVYDAQPTLGPPAGEGMRVVSAPHWTAALLFAAPPAAWTWRRLRHRGRHRAGLCPACGYDLTGNISGTCPECGTAVKK